MASALRRISSFSGVTVGQNSDGKARPRERMPPDKDFGQAEFAAEHAHLVLEQFAQGLDQLHVHALGQAADIVMRLDRHRGPPVKETLSITSG